MIGNSMGVVPSAGMGVAQKLAAFIMLVPSSFSQGVSAFVAQNYGAQKIRQSKKSTYLCNWNFIMLWCLHVLLGIFQRRYACINILY